MSPRDYSEDELVERPTLDLLETLGYGIADGYAETLGPEGLGRDDQSQVVLRHRLKPKLAELNPELPAAAIEAAVEELVRDRSAMERDPRQPGGHRAAARRRQGRLRRRGGWALDGDGPVRRLDRAVQQRVPRGPPVVGGRSPPHQALRHRLLRQRHPAGAAGAEGLPQDSRAGLPKNLRDYRDTIPQLFTPERVRRPLQRLGDEGGRDVRASGSASASGSGSTTSPSPASSPSRPRSAASASRARLLDMVENFVAYLERPGGLIKVLAQNHQVLGVNAAMRGARRPERTRDGRLGVFWHTQGSGRASRCCSSPRRCCDASPATGPS